MKKPAYKEHSLTHVKNAETGVLETVVVLTLSMDPESAYEFLTKAEAPKSAIDSIGAHLDEQKQALENMGQKKPEKPAEKNKADK